MNLQPTTPMIRNIISANDPDAMHFTVFDGDGNKIYHVSETDIESQTVTAFVFDGKGDFRIDQDGNPLKITYKPRGGIKLVDHREQSDA